MNQISICIPTYNGSRYLKETLESILSQSYADFEVIIVDDHSTDSTPKILEEFSSQDPRIKIFHNEKNLGLVENWNKCIAVSNTDWIKFLFQDDLMDKNCLDLMMEATFNQSKFIACSRRLIFENNIAHTTKEFYTKLISLPEQFHTQTYIDKHLFAHYALLYTHNFIGEPSNTLIHKSVFEKYGLFNSSFSQICDLEYWIRLGLNEGITIIPDHLVQFRVHNNSTSTANAQSNSFRSNELDYLLLLHEFAYNPYFSILNKTHTIYGEKINFKKEFGKKANWIKNKAKTIQKKNHHSNAMDHWNEIAKNYPKFENSPYVLYHRLEDYIKNILWRFHK